MWKNTLTSKPLWRLLLLLVLLLLAGWQWSGIQQLGQRWQQLPHRHSASALADFAEFQALRALAAEDGEVQQQLVDELAAAAPTRSVRLHDAGGRLLAEAGTPDGTTLPYVRTLYENDRPVGFLHLELSESALTSAQSHIWQRLQHHLAWLVPLAALLGAAVSLFPLGRRAAAKKQEAGRPPEGSSG